MSDGPLLQFAVEPAARNTLLAVIDAGLARAAELEHGANSERHELGRDVREQLTRARAAIAPVETSNEDTPRIVSLEADDLEQIRNMLSLTRDAKIPWLAGPARTAVPVAAR